MARDKVVNLVESWVASGKLRAGDSLPAEQKISDDLGIARGTVRSGLKLLEDRKVICKRNQRRIVAELEKIMKQILGAIAPKFFFDRGGSTEPGSTDRTNELTNERTNDRQNQIFR